MRSKAWTVVLLILAASFLATPFTASRNGQSGNLKTTNEAVPNASGPVYQVSLDANSTSQTDVSMEASSSQSRSFRIGAVINSSATAQLNGVYGWQFGITYNASAFVPQGDPGSSTYPDGATNTALFGAQTTAGTVNWAGKIAAGQGFGSSRVCSGTIGGCAIGEIFVFFTTLYPAPAVTISAMTLLANVNFELITKPSTSQRFNITDVIFAAAGAVGIPNIVAGSPVVEAITNSPPHAGFTVSPATKTGPFAFSFNASSSFDSDDGIPSPGGYFWDFGDGNQDLGVTGPIVTHDYGVNGSFVATLRLQDILGATGSARDSLGAALTNSQPSHLRQNVGTLPPDIPPTASFIFYPGSNSSFVNFDASASTDPDGNIISYRWDFGDGSSLTSTGAFSQHIYAPPGNYTVVLTVTDNANLTGSISHQVPIRAPITTGLGLDGSTSAFCNHSTNSCSATLNTSNANDIIIVFAFESLDLQYQCGFSVTDTGGLSWATRGGIVFSADHRWQMQEFWARSAGVLSSDTITESILGCASYQYGGEYNGLQAFGVSGANFNNPFDPNAGLPGTGSDATSGPQSVTSVTVSTSNSNDFVYASVLHGTLAVPSPGPGFTPIIAAPTWGAEYQVEKAVLNNSQVTFSFNNVSVWIQIGDAIMVQGSTVGDELPTASFTFSPTNASAGEFVSFDGSSSVDSDGYIQTWNWVFGDGYTAVGSRVSHSYISPGNYTVTLTVTDSAGLSASTSQVVAVRSGQNDEPPVAFFTWTQTSIVPYLDIFFNASASYDPDGFIVTWNWCYGYGSCINFGPQVTTGYFTRGNYTVTLTVTDSSGLTASVTHVVTVLGVQDDEPPTASFTYTPHNVTVGTQVFFDGTLSKDPDGTLHPYSYYWSFGDGYSVNGPQVYHSYSLPGNYTVTLTVTDNLGLTGTAASVVQVQPDEPPTTSIVYAPSNPEVGQQVVFYGNATDPDGYITNWSWSFGDGFNYTYLGPTVYHYYSAPGNYTVTLVVTDSNGLTARATIMVTVHPRPAHDVALAIVYGTPPVVVASEPATVEVGIINLGTNNETVSVTAYYGSNVIGTLTGILVPVTNCPFCGNGVSVQISWDTTGVVPGNYTISATVFLAGDPTPADNTASDGVVRVLPGPTLTISPTSGPVGTTVVLHGAGFPDLPPYYPRFIDHVKITFDSPTVGSTGTNNGSFNFTFSVPFTQPGSHLIEALDEVTGAHVIIYFQVLPTPAPGNLGVTITSGAVYFPSDTAVISVQVTLNGLPANPANLQVILFRPDGTNTTLTATSVGLGRFKATYAVPRTRSIGTYQVVATAHVSGPLDATTLSGFEVKPSWLSSNASTLAAGTTAVALVGLVAFAWQKGYIQKKKDDSPTDDTWVSA